MSSLEDLRSDLQKKDAASMAALPVDVRKYFLDEVWPFMEAIIDVCDEQQDALDEAIEQSQDFLHGETAKEIGKPIGIGFAMADELEKRLGPADGALRTLIAEFRASAAIAMATLNDITIPDDEPEDGEAEGEDVEDDDAEGDE